MITLAVFVISVICYYFYSIRNFDYWKVRGVKHDNPIPIFGTNYDNYMMKKSFSQITVEAYRKYPNEKIVGVFRSAKPELVIRDPDIVKRILVTDFAYFHKRGVFVHKTLSEPLAKNMFLSDGDLWKLLRTQLSPAFTSSKLKAMFPLIVERANRLQSRLVADAAKRLPIPAREMMARYTTEFIGACVFGLDSDSLNDDHSKFRAYGKKAIEITLWQSIVIILKDAFPNTFKYLKIMGKMEKETYDLLEAIQKDRNYQPSGRHDFVDLLLEIKQKGPMTVESVEKFTADSKPQNVQMELDKEIMAASLFTFFAAGFETSSSATSYTLLKLAFNPEVQRKVQKEIDNVLSRHNNRLSYDAIREMNYLECAFKEGMRKLTPSGFLVRQCTKKYTIPEVGLTIDEGVGIRISTQALHMDSQYYESPNEYRPERFLPENINDITKFTYLPFGAGPRSCVGERLGLMQSIAGLAAVLSRFTVKPTPDTLEEPILDPMSPIAQSIIGDIPLYFHERK